MSTFTSLRDDTTHRSLSLNERTFLRTNANPPASSSSSSSSKSVLRIDGRSPGENRPLRLTFGRSHNRSETTVRFGSGTRASASVTCDLVPPPNPDRPNDGPVRFAVDLSPMGCMGYDSVNPVTTQPGGGGDNDGGGGRGSTADDEQQRLLSNRILRILERTVLSGGAIDAEALCVQSGKWVWRLSVDVTLLDQGGNAIDACVLAALAALRHYRKPEVEIESGQDEGGGGDVGGPIVLHSDEREPTPLPLHHTPLTTTFALFAPDDGAGGGGGGSTSASAPASATAVGCLLDPTDREELVTDGTLTLSYNKHGEMCSLDFPGGCELRPRQLLKCASLGKDRCVELCQTLEKALAEADERASNERMERLRMERGGGAPSTPAPPLPPGMPSPPPSGMVAEEEKPPPSGDVPFAERSVLESVSDAGWVEAGTEQARRAEEEERYRLQALDYALGHVAAKVKDDAVDGRGDRRGGGRSGAGAEASSSLMAAMLRSASAAPAPLTSTTTATTTSSVGGGAKVDVTVEVDSRSERKRAKTQPSAVEGRQTDGMLAASPLSSAHTAAADAAASSAVATTDDMKARDVGASDGAASAPMSIDSDDDEEATTTLRSEFRDEPVGVRHSMAANDDDDLDDLAMAVTKKPKKGKKGKKKQKDRG